MVLACGLDRCIGDPQGWPHPVQAMGALITAGRRLGEGWAGDRTGRLRLAGTLVALLTVALAGLAGWGIEQLARRWPLAGVPLLLIGLASALAGGSLERAVRAVLERLDEPQAARARLAWIVGRDVDGLDRAGILRAAAETASENAVDGLFAPLFWMLVGVALWVPAPAPLGAFTPGPLCLAWIFKAASTLDSMVGYRRGRLRWFGTAGARLDDLLTWLPCRLVALTLPLVALPRVALPRLLLRPGQLIGRFRATLRDGRADPSPNAGVSQAAWAHATGVRLGGTNRYGGVERSKPMLGPPGRGPEREDVERMLQLSLRLEGLWLAASAVSLAVLAGWTARPLQ
ncbi:MAG: adenosylcobinamide-phosphate synthase CbiB [Cyanobium sp.]